jgi:excinuclease ABC subunit A
MGPEGGDKGGQVVAEGTPEEIAATKGSITGKFLAVDAKETQPAKTRA